MATEKEPKGGETLEAREAMERVAEIGREYVEATSAAAISGLKTAFDLQGDAIAAGRSVADATIEASKQLADQWAEAVREGQAATTKLAETSAKLAATAFKTS
jgi:hypothetical protein